MSDIAIKLENISKYYKLYNSPKDRLKEALNPFGKKYHKEFYAIKNINLEVKKGEILGVVGRNGCGKSTLLKLISSVLTPDKGSVKVNGKITALLELGAGFNPEFTGLQNIHFYAKISGLSNQEVENVLDSIIDFADIGDYISQPVKSYSSGMRARLGFAVAVHVEPEILILDEVLAVGDVLFQRKCYAKMEEFFKGGKTILYVSHNANSVNELCTRAVFLDAGEVLLESDPKTVTTCYQQFVFSKPENIPNLKKEIINKTKSTFQQEKNNKENISTDFIKSLTTKPKEVNDNVAQFYNVLIKDKYDNIVNQLATNDIYKMHFVVRFYSNLNDVAIGAQIRTNKGVLISGLNSKDYNDDVLKLVNRGEEYEVNVAFNCYLLPDVYLITVFIKDGSEKVAIKYDAFMFKVKNDSAKQGGYITLNQQIVTKKIKPLEIQ